MSREARIERRALKRKRRLGLIGIAVILIVLLMVISRVNKQQKVLRLSDWVVSEKTTLYFFKDVDSVTINGFRPSDLSVEAGTKVNGYTPLTKEEMVVNLAWVDKRIQLIKSMISTGAPESWPSEVEQVMHLNSSQNIPGGAGRTLADIAPFVGCSEESLKGIMEKLTALRDGAARAITLQNLGTITNGYIYTSISSKRMALNECFLPNLSLDLLNAVDRMSTGNETMLNVISNDHVFVTGILDGDISIPGEEQTAELKAQFLEESGSSENSYYEMLVQRMDLVQEYPMKSIVVGDSSAKVYLVDVISDGNKKLPVMLLKDILTGFVTRDVVQGEIVLNSAYGYVVPKSAIKTNADGEEVITLMRKKYFPKEVPVEVLAADENNLILSAEDNPDLSEGESYKIHP